MYLDKVGLVGHSEKEAISWAGRRCDDAVARQQASQPVPAGTIMFQCGEMAAVPPGGTNGNFILLLIVISQEFTAIIIFQIITFFNYKMALIILAHASPSLSAWHTSTAMPYI